MCGLLLLLKKSVYWIRVGIAFPILFFGFCVEDFGICICRLGHKTSRVGDRIQEVAVNIEGDIPDEEPIR